MANQTTTPESSDLRTYPDRHESTPPDNGTPLPLTPPATDERFSWRLGASNVDKVMRMFEACRDQGAAPASLTKFCLPLQQYDELVKRLQDDQSLGRYVEDKVRFDYEPEPGLLIVRMPSPVHEFFTASVEDEMYNQLTRVGEFAAKIAKGRSSRIFLKEGISGESSEVLHTVRREPDGQFQHHWPAYPGVVLEVSYSQDRKDLRKLASDYILGSNGDIKAVIGLDVNYNGKQSTVSLWRPNYFEEDGEEILEVRQEIVNKPFRASDGSPVNHTECLTLSLSDFATDEISSGDEPVSLSIQFGRLADFLAQAEQIHQAREPDNRQGVKSSRRPKKRRLPSSPAEELRSEDEAEYRRRGIPTRL
ncbi:hypothetical protein QBC46DRAFT_27069 [Diplogelasinospora grovesii]|uniref:Uncharacterized protein n=1 Tax=Diplogelasinospora grovesii TaxID=303347 RepID=A0AAN6S7S4_9PEZI|nr:hypothetical protein QBC46DRAFT_27069 [Diplogelasinospora grovesii]